jgi:hypothetical protein
MKIYLISLKQGMEFYDTQTAMSNTIVFTLVTCSATFNPKYTISMGNYFLTYD